MGFSFSNLFGGGVDSEGNYSEEEAEERKQEVIDALNQSLEDYAVGLAGKSRRQLLDKNYKAPNIVDGLNYSDPNVKKYADFWTEAFNKWQKEYGNVKGWSRFKSIFDTRYYGDPLGDVSVKQQYFGSEFQSLRDAVGTTDGSGSADSYLDGFKYRGYTYSYDGTFKKDSVEQETYINTITNTYETRPDGFSGNYPTTYSE